MNYKILFVFCVIFVLGSVTSAQKQVRNRHAGYHRIFNPILPDFVDPSNNNKNDQASEDNDEPSETTRLLLAENVLAREGDIEGTVAYVDGNCVLVRTCMIAAEDGELRCDEQHVCEY